MVTVEQAKAIAMALPGAEQSSHFDNADFRVRGKIFARFPALDQMTIRVELEHARILIASDPDTYVPHAGVWGDRGWLRVILTRVTVEELTDLVYDSWYRLAPKKLRDESTI